MTFVKSPYYRMGDPDSGVRRGLMLYPYVMFAGRAWDFDAGWYPCTGWVEFYKANPNGFPKKSAA